jgi:hypothetical protein
MSSSMKCEKTIGLVTFHESDNYGTCLQAFALQRSIEKLGYKVEILQYQRKHLQQPSKVSLVARIKALLAAFPGLLIFSYPLVKKRSIRKKNSFRKFRNENLIYSSTKYDSFEELKYANSDYDAFVCGSDMIWSAERAGDLDVYFLRFADKTKRIAYAPSFGGVIEPASEDYYRELLLEMRYLSCREPSGCNLIKELTGRSAEYVLDPTMLVDKEQWSSFFPPDINANKPYILCYCFGGVPTPFKSSLHKLAKILNCAVRYIPANYYEYKKEIKYSNCDYGPREFVQLYQQAYFIITNSYHGLLFSLIFEKPFFVLHRDERDHWALHEDRMASMLSSLNLSDRYIYAQDKISDEQLTVNYDVVGPILEKWKIESLNYLEKAISESIKGKAND